MAWCKFRRGELVGIENMFLFVSIHSARAPSSYSIPSVKTTRTSKPQKRNNDIMQRYPMFASEYSILRHKALTRPSSASPLHLSLHVARSWDILLLIYNVKARWRNRGTYVIWSYLPLRPFLIFCHPFPGFSLGRIHEPLGPSHSGVPRPSSLFGLVAANDDSFKPRLTTKPLSYSLRLQCRLLPACIRGSTKLHPKRSVPR